MKVAELFLWRITVDKVIIFGGGPTGLTTYERLKNRTEIVAFFDNDKQKTNKSIEGIPVFLPDEELLRKLSYDYIVVASVYGNRQIRAQLNEMGVPGNKVVEHPDDPNLLPSFLKSLAEDFTEENMGGGMCRDRCVQRRKCQRN